MVVEILRAKNNRFSKNLKNLHQNFEFKKFFAPKISRLVLKPLNFRAKSPRRQVGSVLLFWPTIEIYLNKK